ncbi:MarR family winged helix-turn-helix transcriptional regulator [Zobellia nedashkovskayae]
MKMDFEFPNKTVFYHIEDAIKSYRNFAQLQIDKTGCKITINQLLLLFQISEKPILSQVELSETLLKDVASTTRMIQLLVNRNYLERTENSNDRRKKELIVTENGEKVLTTLKPVINSYREQALNGFSKEEVSELSRLLNKLIVNVK